jgi:hypothetical protein
MKKTSKTQNKQKKFNLDVDLLNEIGETKRDNFEIKLKSTKKNLDIKKKLKEMKKEKKQEKNPEPTNTMVVEAPKEDGLYFHSLCNKDQEEKLKKEKNFTHGLEG